MKHLIIIFLSLTASLLSTALCADGTLERFAIQSKVLKKNKLGIDTQRNVLVYLPDGYAISQKRYPVLYYFHNAWWNNEKLFGEENGFKQQLDLAIRNRQLSEFIVVAGDFTAPRIGSFYSNASLSGRWRDHITEELIPAVDKRYKTHAMPEARFAAGDFFGGYAVIRLAMDHPQLFSAIYAAHPVGTATGETLMISRPDWKVMNTAQTWEELEQANQYSPIFMFMAQAFLPNAKKPPFYANLMVELVGDELVVNAANVKKLRDNFLLDEMVPNKASALRQLHAFKMDWGRLDNNPDHVYANQKFTRLLSEYGVNHEAEEYNGGPWDKLWGEYGRVRTDMLPFFQRALMQQQAAIQ